MNLSGEDIVKIIKEAGKAGVSYLEVGEVKINFSEVAPPSVTWSVSPKSTRPQFTGSIMNSDTSLDMTDGPLPPEDEEVEEDLLLITDPSEWEERTLKVSSSKA